MSLMLFLRPELFFFIRLRIYSIHTLLVLHLHVKLIEEIDQMKQRFVKREVSKTLERSREVMFFLGTL